MAVPKQIFSGISPNQQGSRLALEQDKNQVASAERPPSPQRLRQDRLLRAEPLKFLFLRGICSWFRSSYASCCENFRTASAAARAWAGSQHRLGSAIKANDLPGDIARLHLSRA